MFHSVEPVLNVLRNQVHPIGIRNVARQTGLQKKVCRAILRNLVTSGTIQKVDPCSVGSNKVRLSLYKL